MADKDLVIGLLKFKMAEPIWSLKIRRKLIFHWKLVYRGFRGQDFADQDFNNRLEI